MEGQEVTEEVVEEVTLTEAPLPSEERQSKYYCTQTLLEACVSRVYHQPHWRLSSRACLCIAGATSVVKLDTLLESAGKSEFMVQVLYQPTGLHCLGCLAEMRMGVGAAVEATEVEEVVDMIEGVVEMTEEVVDMTTEEVVVIDMHQSKPCSQCSYRKGKSLMLVSFKCLSVAANVFAAAAGVQTMSQGHGAGALLMTVAGLCST